MRERLVAGVDEAGRGPLAGPVVAAAVMLDPGQRIPGLDDSKKLTPRRRAILAAQIRERASCWAVAWADVAEIDTLNILQGTLLAMRRAVQGLSVPPTRVLVDGNQLPVLARAPVCCDVEAVVGGDGRVAAIAAASILAKVHRDDAMQRWHALYPAYGFDRHKGYGTEAHMRALAHNGPCPIHRMSFAPVRAARRPANPACREETA